MNSKRHRSLCLVCVFIPFLSAGFWLGLLNSSASIGPLTALAASSCCRPVDSKGQALDALFIPFPFFLFRFLARPAKPSSSRPTRLDWPFDMLAASLVVVLLTVSGTRLTHFIILFLFFPSSDSGPGLQAVIWPTHIDRPF